MDKAIDKSQLVLVVEDNQDSRELVVKILRAKEYAVIEAYDGEEALHKIKEKKPDLILMDISIPKVDGLEVTRQIKNQNNLKNIPVIALTAHAMKGDREKILNAGCDGYIAKPFAIRELTDLVKKFIEAD